MRRHHFIAVAVLVVLFIGVAAKSMTQGARLTGVVLDALSDQPLEGVRIAVRSGVGVISTATARTDAGGHFTVTVAPGPVALSFSIRGYERLGLNLGSVPVGPETVRLRHSVPIRGIIVDPVGQRVQGARIRLVPIGPGGLQQVLQAFTRRDGSYQIDGAAPDRHYRVEARRAGCVPHTLRFESGTGLSEAGEWWDVVECR